MSGWPLTVPGFTVLDRFDTTTTAEYTTTVTAGGTAHTKGSWTEIDASTSQDAHAVSVGGFLTQVSAVITGTLVDIGIGASGSETVLIENILSGWHGGSSMSEVPVFIPAGTRIAARAQSIAASKTVGVGLRLLSSPNDFNRDLWQFGNPVTYGADTANSRGTRVYSTLSHTRGAWIEMTASTTQPHSGIGVSVQGHSDPSLSSQNGLVDVGFGASGSEEVLLSNLKVSQASTEYMTLIDAQIIALGIGRTLPIGTRLVARVQFVTGSNAEISLCLHGVT